MNKKFTDFTLADHKYFLIIIIGLGNIYLRSADRDVDIIC